MLYIEPSFDIIWLLEPKSMLQHIEKCAKKCYQSTHTITDTSYSTFIPRLIDSGHESTIEHISVTVDIICDRGITHEAIRHRICAFSQESTRYCNYVKDKFGNETTVIRPFFFDINEKKRPIELPNLYNGNHTLIEANSFDIWLLSNLFSEWAYFQLINSFNRTAQEARSVLTNSLKTSISITANLREWRHIFNLRCDKPAHPQMRQIMLPLLNEFNLHLPEIFKDIYTKYEPFITSFQEDFK